MRSLNVGEAVCVPVSAKALWNHSGILARQGERFTLETGNVADWRDAWVKASPDGQNHVPWVLDNKFARSFLRYPHAEWYALVGAMDERLDTCFLVGRSVTLEAGHGGELCFFANDALWAYGNNHGTLDLTITRTG